MPGWIIAIAGIAFILAIWGFFMGLAMLVFFNGKRKRGAIVMACCVALVCGEIGSIFIQADRAAVAAGYDSASDQSKAESAGSADPKPWVERVTKAAEIDEKLRLLAIKKQEAEAWEKRLEADKAKAEIEEAKTAAAQKVINEQKKKGAGMHCLSAWDGSNSDLMNAVKAQMRDPDSFQHIETRIAPVDAQGNNAVMMRFRARNGFGGMNVGMASGVINNASCSLISWQLLAS